MVGGRPEQAQEDGLLVQAAWRVVGAAQSPLKNPELRVWSMECWDRCSRGLRRRK